MAHRLRRRGEPPPGSRSHSTAEKIVRMASADSSGIPLRKIADLLMVAAGCWMIIEHAEHEHEHIHWQAWALLAIGGGDLGIQSIGKILDRYLKLRK